MKLITKILKAKSTPFILMGTAFIIPLIIAFITVFTGNVPFWYDNARDMLSAWDNLSKPTLIGPTSGIPGIFYGPYWIWLLSIGVLLSKDPRVAHVVAGLVPYCFVFPFLLLKFSKLFGKTTIILIWLLFIFSIGMNYATSLWNPHLAPVLFLLVFYLLLFTNHRLRKNNDYIKIFSAGVASGLVINFHISFGLGVLLGIVLFFIVSSVFIHTQQRKEGKKVFLSTLLLGFLFCCGMAITFAPFFLFEIKHGFLQTQKLFQALTTYGAVVTLKGMGKEEILQFFFGRLGVIFHIPWLVAFIGEIAVALYLFIKRKELKLSASEKKFLLLLFCISSGILFIYLTAKNPVWEYHFIGTEIIFLLALAFALSKIPFLKHLVTIWVIGIILLASNTFIKNLSSDPHIIPSLATKEYIVDIVASDAGQLPYTVFNFSPSIYTYEYTYLFKWRHAKDMPFDPGTIAPNANLVYLIIPKAPRAIEKDFIEYKTPQQQYQTTNTWIIADGTIIIKREKK